MPFRLRTFGGLSLTGESGPVTGAAAQRRKLALLAVLATGGERGVSRDRPLPPLWPESDAGHALHPPRQSLSDRKRAGRRTRLPSPSPPRACSICTRQS